MPHMLLSLAEWERDSIRGRTQAGVDRAAAEGRTGGRPPALDSEKITSREGLPGRRQVGQRGRQNLHLQCEPGYYQGRQGLDLHEADGRSQC